MTEGLEGATREATPYADLARKLEALASERRLVMLKELAVERRLREIRTRLSERRLAGSDGDAISVEAVRRHLVKLKEAGVAASEPDLDSRAGADLWTFDPRGLHVIIESLREFLSGATAEAPWVTREASGFRLAQEWTGPQLQLVHGGAPGAVFPLRAEARTRDRGWVIGRLQGLAITLDYDAFLSSENSEVVPTGEGFELLDLRTSRNGTYHNWRKLPPGGQVRLRDGDVIGAGRSLLLFRT